jgi:hypothetical protein
VNVVVRGWLRKTVWWVVKGVQIVVLSSFEDGRCNCLRTGIRMHVALSLWLVGKVWGYEVDWEVV